MSLFLVHLCEPLIAEFYVQNLAKQMTRCRLLLFLAVASGREGGREDGLNDGEVEVHHYWI